MKAKILELMQREGLKPGQLADLLDTSPAIISHILSERNKPSLDLLCKILRRFPQINPDWLLLDDPNMYRVDQGSAAVEKATSAPSAPSDPREKNSEGFRGGLFDVAETLASQQHSSDRQGTGNFGKAASSPETAYGHLPENRPVTRVIVCYADGSFESFLPTKR